MPYPRWFGKRIVAHDEYQAKSFAVTIVAKVRLTLHPLEALVPGGLLVVQDYVSIDRSPGHKRLDTLEHLYVMVAFDPGAADREGDDVVSWL